MDIAGAKALKKRLGPNGTDDTRPASIDVPEDARPVYHWTGKTPVETAPSAAEDDNEPRGASLFSRLSLGFR